MLSRIVRLMIMIEVIYSLAIPANPATIEKPPEPSNTPIPSIESAIDYNEIIENKPTDDGSSSAKKLGNSKVSNPAVVGTKKKKAATKRTSSNGKRKIPTKTADEPAGVPDIAPTIIYREVTYQPKIYTKEEIALSNDADLNSIFDDDVDIGEISTSVDSFLEQKEGEIPSHRWLDVNLTSLLLDKLFLEREGTIFSKAKFLKGLGNDQKVEMQDLEEEESASNLLKSNNIDDLLEFKDKQLKGENSTELTKRPPTKPIEETTEQDLQGKSFDLDLALKEMENAENDGFTEEEIVAKSDQFDKAFDELDNLPSKNEIELSFEDMGTLSYKLDEKATFYENKIADYDNQTVNNNAKVMESRLELLDIGVNDAKSVKAASMEEEDSKLEKLAYDLERDLKDLDELAVRKAENDFALKQDEEEKRKELQIVQGDGDEKKVELKDSEIKELKADFQRKIATLKTFTNDRLMEQSRVGEASKEAMKTQFIQKYILEATNPVKVHQTCQAIMDIYEFVPLSPWKTTVPDTFKKWWQNHKCDERVCIIWSEIYHSKENLPANIKILWDNPKMHCTNIYQREISVKRPPVTIIPTVKSILHTKTAVKKKKRKSTFKLPEKTGWSDSYIVGILIFAFVLYYAFIYLR